MSTGSDVIEVLQGGYEVYKAVKDYRKDLDDEDQLAATEVARLKKAAAALHKVLGALPDALSRAEGTAAVQATRALVNERLKNQQQLMDFEEIMKLQGALYLLRLHETKLKLLDHFDVRAAILPSRIEVLLADVQAVQKEIKTQLKVQAAYRIGIRTAIFTIDLGMLIVKAIA